MTPILGRRSFFAYALAASVAGSLGTQSSTAQQRDSDACGRTSAADSLWLASSLFQQAQNRIYTSVSRCLVHQLRDYEAAFRELYGLVKALEAEMAKTGSTSQLTELELLAGLGQSHTSLLRTAVATGLPSEGTRNLSAIAGKVITEAAGVRTAVQKQLVLSPAASDLLRQIIALVNSERFRALAAHAEAANKDYSTFLSLVSESFAGVTQSLDSARIAIISAHRAEQQQLNDERSARLHEATVTLRRGVYTFAALLRRVLVFLKSCPESAPSEVSKVPLEQLDVLLNIPGYDNPQSAPAFGVSSNLLDVLLGEDEVLTKPDMFLVTLDGIRRFVEGGEPLAPPTADTSLIRPISYVVAGKSTTELLKDYCMEDSALRAAWLNAKILCVGGYTPFVNKQRRLQLIRNVLKDFECAAPSDKESLAEGLA